MMKIKEKNSDECIIFKRISGASLHATNQKNEDIVIYPWELQKRMNDLHQTLLVISLGTHQ